MSEWWQWLRHLRQNPVYLREKGTWGNPNPFYQKLSRYSPFVVMGAIVFGLCAGTSNPALFAGNDDLLLFWCLLCLPGALLSMLTIFGLVMAPALTAPSISLEMDRGTWDILRLTPQPTAVILLAKLFGGLARLRIWPLLFVLSLFQGALMMLIAVLGGDIDANLSLWSGLLGLTTLLRPWLEILFAAFAGMYVSTWVRSATVSLVASYVAVFTIRILNSSGVWILLGGMTRLESTGLFVGGTLGPTAVYAILLPALAFGIVRRADTIGNLESYG